MPSQCRDPADNGRLLAEWAQHPDKDEWWDQEDTSLHFGQMDVPCFTQGSWCALSHSGKYVVAASTQLVRLLPGRAVCPPHPCLRFPRYDYMNQGSVESFIGRQHQGGPNSRGTQRLLIGPW